MENPLENYWRIRLAAVRELLESNGFEAYVAENEEAATQIVLERILPAAAPRSISWGGSMTFIASGIYGVLRNREDVQIIDTFAKDIPPEEALERRRQALLADMFITGTNAVTEAGQLVNLDMYGNRVAAITFGPRSVVILAGRNKIVPELEDAMFRIKDYAAPANAMRLDKKTPCVKTATCQDCNSPDRICNTWTITEKSFPKGRIKVILINRELGL